MNKANFFFVIALYMTSFCLRAEMVAGDYEVFSEAWPQRVFMTEPLTLENGKTISEGKSFILIRVEQGDLLADFGHNGLVRVDPAMTNFDELFQKNRQTKTWDSPGVFSEHIARSFFMPDTLQQCQIDLLRRYDYLLLVYADIGTPETGALIDSVKALEGQGHEQRDEPAILIIPMDDSREELKEDLAKSGISYPVMFQFLAEGYQISFDHHPESTPVVLVDKNGRVLKSFSAEEVRDTEAFVSAVYAVEAAHQGERILVRRESL